MIFGKMNGRKLMAPYWGLAFTAEQAGSTVAMQKSSAFQPPAVSLETSVDGGKTWAPFVVGETTITLANVGDSVCFRAGDGGTGGDGVNLAMATSASAYNRFVMSGRIAASGDVSSILDRRGTVDRLNDSYCFYRLFFQCTSLTAAPKLPATTLGRYCYLHMFYGCTSLTTAPELPATMLAVGCYANMFRDCTALTVAPELPATTLAVNCYTRMFVDCRQIASIRVHFTDWVTNATTVWVDGVNQSGTFICPESLPHGENNFSDSGIPPGWTVQTFTPQNP